MRKIFEKNMDYWKTDDPEYPYEDEIGKFLWITLTNGAKMRLHKGYTIGENFTMYNASVKIQHMVDSNKGKYKPDSSYQHEYGLNEYWFKTDRAMKITLTNVLIIVEDNTNGKIK